MNRTLQLILQKVESVQLGLIRFQNDDQKHSLQARAGADENQLNCIISQADGDLCKLPGKVNLIQKDKNDYLYIACRVKDKVLKGSAMIMSMEVVKACWFIRRSKGSVSWFKEKYAYQAEVGDIEMAS